MLRGRQTDWGGPLPCWLGACLLPLPRPWVVVCLLGWEVCGVWLSVPDLGLGSGLLVGGLPLGLGASGALSTTSVIKR